MIEKLKPVPGEKDCRINSYIDRHERYKAEAKESESDIVFIGDSLIEHLQQTEIWDVFSQMHALNFGMSGDKTQNVLWRLQNGELAFEDYKPKVFVLLIGTNNEENTDDIVDSINDIVNLIHQIIPSAYILILKLFPKGLYPCPEREKIGVINKLLAQRFGTFNDTLIQAVANNSLQHNQITAANQQHFKHGDQYKSQQIQLLDLDPGFVQPDGRISHLDMYDYLHLTKRGYEKAFGPLVELLKSLLDESPPDTQN